MKDYLERRREEMLARKLPQPKDPQLKDPRLKDPLPCHDLLPAQRPGGTPVDIDMLCFDWQRYVSWETPSGQFEVYEDWPEARKARLNTLFQMIMRNEPDLGLDCPDPHVSIHYLTEAQAEDVYLAHMAFALWLDASGKLSWRLRDWETELGESALNDTFFRPEVFHQPIRTGTSATFPPGMDPGEWFRLPYRHLVGYAMLCDPRDGHVFLQHHNLIAPDPESTLARITAWVRDEMLHGLPNIVDPKERMLLRDRLERYAITVPGEEQPMAAYWNTLGCHSAAATVADLARAVNIPLLLVESTDSQGSSHSGLVFRWGSATKPMRVLNTLDHIISQYYQKIVFPTVREGAGVQAANDEEKDRQYFDRFWLTREQLADNGFTVAMNLLSPFGPPDDCRDHECVADDNGWAIGSWQKGDRENGDNDQFVYELYYSYELASDYFLGGSRLLQKYCNGTSAEMEIYVEQHQGQPSPHNFSAAQFTDRAAAVVGAYGDCEEIGSRIEAWMNFMHRPTDSQRPPRP